MKQIIESLLSAAIIQLKTDAIIPADVEVRILIDRTKDISHGDFSTNIALMLSKSCGVPARELAVRIQAALPAHPVVVRTEVAGAGFLNFFLQKAMLTDIIPRVLREGDNFGSSTFGKGQKVLLEFVSSNPTGPLHVGHGRSAAFGASLATLLAMAGFEVTREYYINDAGRQMSILAVSVWLRYLMLAQQPVVFPANAYKGEYVSDIAQHILDTSGMSYVKSWADITRDLPLDEPEGGDKELYIDALISQAKVLLGEPGFKLFHQAALTTVLADIKADLQAFGVNYDKWFSEQTLWDSGAIDKSIHALKEGGHTYEKKGALWFNATAFGDEKDRVLLRANGQPTYFAADVAYHWDKYERGYDCVIDVFGADHHGYISRIQSAVKALGHDEQALRILLVQFAILYREGTRVQMSTRSGSFVTLRELREEVGNDAARFFYVMRKSEQHMDFDLDLAKSQSNDNPVYYIQYAHARISSVMRQLQERGLLFDEPQGLSVLHQLDALHEQALITLIAKYPDVIEKAAQACEPHQVAYYLRELAQSLHSYYNAIQLICEDVPLRNARLCLLLAVRHVLKNGLHLLGVSSPESM